MPITLLDLILLGGDADFGAARDGPRVHARGAVDRLVGGGRAAHALLLPQAQARSLLQYFTNDIVASAITIGGVFLGTLLIVSIITIKISDMILDSRVGALDRTLGFLFGLGARAGDRGRRLPVLRLAGAGPQPARMGEERQVAGGPAGNRAMADVDVAGDPESTILKRLKRNKPEDQDQPDSADRRPLPALDRPPAASPLPSRNS